MEIEYQIEADGSVKEAGQFDWLFTTDAGSSGDDRVNSHGAEIWRADGNTSGESVSAQFSASLNRNHNLVLTDQNSESNNQNGAGKFRYQVTVYGTNNNTSPPSQISVTTDPMIYNH